jgi:hypothetical protein
MTVEEHCGMRANPTLIVAGIRVDAIAGLDTIVASVE